MQYTDKKPVRTRGHLASKYAREGLPFKNSNNQLYGQWETPLMYVVYSYGPHWPLFVWDGFDWYENEDKYSPTTSKHRTQAHPLKPTQPRSCSWLIKHILSHKNYAATPAQTANQTATSLHV